MRSPAFALSNLCSRFLAGFLAFLIVCGLTHGETPSRSDKFVPGELLLKLDPDLTPPWIEAIIDQLSKSLGASIKRQYNFDQHLFLLEFPDDEALQQALRRINPENPVETIRVVQYAHRNYIVQATRLPDDPIFPRQWNLHNTGQEGKTEDVDVDAPEAWDVTTDGSGPVLAVIDTGVDLDHPDLVANLWENPGEIPNNHLDDDGNEFVDDVHGWNFHEDNSSVADDSLNSHGTTVAGILAASGNNAIGIAGVAWKASIMVVKAFDEFGFSDIDKIIRAVDYAVSNGAALSNNGYAAAVSDGSQVEALQEAVARAEQAGHLMIASAGNNGSDADSTPHYPCTYDLPNVICVAGIDGDGYVPAFSNFGVVSVDLAAPAVDIFSTLRNGEYGVHPQDGTSWAAPHVTGIATLVMSRHPDYTPWQVRESILLGAQPSPTGDLEGRVHTGAVANARVSVGAFGDSFDDTTGGSWFFSEGGTATRWAVAQHGSALCDPVLETLEGTADVAVEARFANLAGAPGSHWTMAGFNGVFPPGHYAQSLVLRIAPADASDLSSAKGKIAVGVIKRNGTSSQFCSATRKNYTEVTFEGSSLAGLEMDGNGGAIPFVFFSVPEENGFYHEQRFAPISLSQVAKASIQIYYGPTSMMLNITDSTDGTILFRQTDIPYPTDWWPAADTFQPLWGYYGVDPGDPTEHRLLVRAFLSVQ